MLHQMELKHVDIRQQPSLSIYVDRFWKQYISVLLIKIITTITIIILLLLLQQ